jgi:ribonuclease E
LAAPAVRAAPVEQVAPAAAQPVVEQVAPASVAATTPVEPARPAPAVMDAAPAIEAPAAPEPVASFESVADNEPSAPAAPAEAHVAAQGILKNDTVESFDVLEAAATPAEAAAVASPVVVEQVEAPPAPPAPKPAAPARPPVGNTGSLFFTADADTPASVTRHLFEPIPTPAPLATEAEKNEAHDLPLIADNDEPSEAGKDHGSERSA